MLSPCCKRILPKNFKFKMFCTDLYIYFFTIPAIILSSWLKDIERKKLFLKATRLFAKIFTVKPVLLIKYLHFKEKSIITWHQ